MFQRKQKKEKQNGKFFSRGQMDGQIEKQIWQKNYSMYFLKNSFIDSFIQTCQGLGVKMSSIPGLRFSDLFGMETCFNAGENLNTYMCISEW